MACSDRKSRGEILSAAEAQWSTTKLDGMWRGELVRHRCLPCAAPPPGVPWGLTPVARLRRPRHWRRARVLAERMRFHERLELRDLRAGIRGLYGLHIAIELDHLVPMLMATQAPQSIGDNPFTWCFRSSKSS